MQIGNIEGERGLFKNRYKPQQNVNYNAIFRKAYISIGRHLSPMKIVKTIYHFLRDPHIEIYPPK